MPYHYSYFASGSSTVVLTTRAGRHDIGSDAARTPAVPLSTGGDFDELGTSRAPRSSQTIRIEETFVGATRFAAIKAWKALHRTKGRLYRVDEQTNIVQWTDARLQAIPIDRGVENDSYQAIGLTFLLPNPIWYGRHHSGDVLRWGHVADGGSGILWGSGRVWSEAAGDTFTLNTGANSVALANDGDQQVDNIILTLTVGSSALTVVHIVNTALGIDWTWTGSVASTKVLAIDTGGQRITNDGTGAYAGYARAGGHTVDTPIAVPVPAGGTTYTITLTGGYSGSGAHTVLVATYSDGYNA